MKNLKSLLFTFAAVNATKPNVHAGSVMWSGNLYKFLLVIPAVGLSMAGTAQAATQLTWTGGNGTAWSTTNNWSTNVVPANDTTTNTAYFNSPTYGTQPTTGTTAVGGLEIGTASTGTLTISGTTLTLGNAGTGTGGTGILKDASSGAATISVTTIKLGQAANVWKNNSSTSLTINSAISGSVAGTNTLTIGSTGSGGIKLNGIISDGTGTTAVAIGTSTAIGVTTLSGANTFTGGLSIADTQGSSVAFTGTLSASSGAVTATAIGKGTVTLGQGATSTLNYTSGSGGFVNNAITLANGGSITLGNSSGSTVTYTAGITGNNSSYTFTISGTSSTIFSGASTYTGSTVVAGNLTLTGSTNGSNMSTSGTGTFTESTAGVIAGAGATFTQASTGTSTLAGANTYTGPTTISSGTLSASNIVVSGGSSNLGNATSAVILGGASTTGTLSYTGNNATYTRGLTVSAGGGEVDSTTSGQTLTIGTGNIDNTSGGLTTFGGGGNTTVTSVIGGGSGGVAKPGAGNLTLANANTYGGPTTLSAGKTYVTGGVNGSSSGTGTNTVGVSNSGTVLAGNGTIGGAVTLNVGTTLYSGGVASGTPSTGAGAGLTLNSALNITNANLTFALNTGNVPGATFSNPNTSTSYLTTTGNVNFTQGGADTITLVDLSNGGLTLRQQQPYLLIAAGSSTEYFGLVIKETNGTVDLSQNGAQGTVLGVWTGTGFGYTAFTFNQFGSDGVNPLAATNPANTSGAYIAPYLYLSGGDLEVVPEPGTWALMLGGLGLLVLIQRRRVRS